MKNLFMPFLSISMLLFSTGCIQLATLALAEAVSDDEWESDEEWMFDDETWIDANGTGVETQASVRGDVVEAQNLRENTLTNIYCNCGSITFYNADERGRDAYMTDVSIDGVPPSELFQSDRRIYRSPNYDDMNGWPEDSTWVGGVACSGEAGAGWYEDDVPVEEVQVDVQPVEEEPDDELIVEDDSSTGSEDGDGDADDEDVDSQEDLIVEPNQPNLVEAITELNPTTSNLKRVEIDVPHEHEGEILHVQYEFLLSDQDIRQLQQDYDNCGW